MKKSFLGSSKEDNSLKEAEESGLSIKLTKKKRPTLRQDTSQTDHSKLYKIKEEEEEIHKTEEQELK